MYNILHVSKIMQDEVSQIIGHNNVLDFNIIMISLDDFIKKGIIFNDFNAIVLGINDGGMDISMRHNDLINAGNAGLGIMYTHDVLEQSNIINEPGFSLNNSNYKDKNSDIMSIKLNLSDHPLVCAYHNLKILSYPIKVTQTHNTFANLDTNDIDIIFSDNKRSDFSQGSNYYLAAHKTKKIIYSAMGHNEGDYNNFHAPVSDFDYWSFVNALYWLC